VLLCSLARLAQILQTSVPSQKVVQCAYNARPCRQPRSAAERLRRRPIFAVDDVRMATRAERHMPEVAMPQRDTGYNPVMETAQRRLA
jgi:hypothetical protein